MAALLFDLAFVVAAAALGAGIGWWLRGSGLLAAANAQEGCGQGEHDAQPPDARQVEGILSRLHHLTASVAADVGEHASRVQAINDELSTGAATQQSALAAIEKLIAANERMERQLRIAEERLQHQAKEIEAHVQEARTDALTSLCNRRGFDDELKTLVEKAAHQQHPLSVMMLDVDHFKKFNDTYGHQAGDEVLKGVARVLRRELADKAVVCRYGGEEFSVLFPESDLEVARCGAEQARQAIGEELVTFDGLDLRVTASAGLAQLLSDESGDQLIKRADAALYRSKGTGRDRGHLHDGRDILPITHEHEEGKSSARDASDAEPIDGALGISDRHAFCRDLDRRLAQWKRNGTPLSVMLLEVDDLSRLVERHGDTARDIVLRAACQFLKATLRDMDHLARFEETSFALLLPDATLDDAREIAERTRKEVERSALAINSQQVTFTVSLGLTEVGNGDSLEELLRRAEGALASARKQQGNCIVTSRKQAAAESVPC
jgi:diguanylate cyclase